ncbi:hypothetical protein E1264_37925 [Actinomadura sp. KC216]|uniref:hypothetical protein n=1 Tax=Actinomadura sp. KC216 TaxID=2530370 RepID=UPI0010535F76|nr:hypothetical protein [Actinomadura sp. KC216]TDB76911.1 hypothetical protein E1264_37925 [Actinomadura sp. KC216]
MNERVTLLLLLHLFPEWTIMRDGAGVWRGIGRILISASDLDGLLESLAVADPDATRRAVALLAESK